MKVLPLASVIGLLMLTTLSPHAAAENAVYVTPYFGYSFSESASDENGSRVRVQDDPHLALALETDMDNGRVGLFISHQPTEMKGIQGDGSLTYVHFQSAVRYQTYPQVDTIFGLSLGTTVSQVDWLDEDLLFSAGVFTGAEYKISHNTRLVFEARWLANRLDGQSKRDCQLQSSGADCQIRFDSEWLSQWQTNLGLSISF
ncbi:hypothetical protein [Photobacterium sp. TY1-4]|uniref:hypothetical protein n=1 Tax=Photobacterium sp. TY1-4 TaxID=2899122 RepID=UPI0021BF083F|nr:hypothetical protein [Photobacterium sp. TY1-4]UXI02530.1 hypothetical protein NH461_07130 [Photobacterium sp. TY1-4]